MRISEAHLRIARPTLDPARARRFYVDGLGMSVLYEGESHVDDRRWELVMCGFHDSSWHLEFTRCEPHTATPSPSSDDLLVFYLADHTAAEQVATSLERCGGTVVPSDNPYWDIGGITIADPDGYRLVVTARTWDNEPPHS